MQRNNLTTIIGGAAILLAGSAALADAGSDAVAARQAHYKELGKAFKAIADQLKSPTPDLAVINANAPVVTRIGQQQNRENWFPAGTQSGQGLQTAAKAVIWQTPVDWNTKRADFANASASYAAIAAEGDLDAIRAATAGVGKTCQSCHEAYRDQDKS